MHTAAYDGASPHSAASISANRRPTQFRDPIENGMNEAACRAGKGVTNHRSGSYS